MFFDTLNDLNLNYTFVQLSFKIHFSAIPLKNKEQIDIRQIHL